MENIVTGKSRERRLFLSICAILIAALSLPLIFAVMRRLGLPFGLRVVAMAEDYNWLLILSGESAARKAQNFWAMNDRNPLSPWWYIAFDRLYTGLPNGPYLTRLFMQPLVGLSAFALVHTVSKGRASGLALGVGLLSALSLFGTTIDQIHWNFLGALSLSMLSVASFATWLNGGRSAPGWYGASLVLWYCAYATYSFQVGAILGIAALSALNPPEGPNRLHRLLASLFEAAPYAALLAAFVLTWKTTQNPAMAGYYALNPSLLFQNLPQSLAVGLSPLRYLPFIAVAWAQLSWFLPFFCLLIGASVAGVYAATSFPVVRARDAFIVTLVAFGLVLPTALIESMSPTWTVGFRWPMVDQAWQPLLWLSLAALVTSRAPVSERVRRNILGLAIGFAAMLAAAASLGYNHVQVSRSLTERAIRQGLEAAVADFPSDRPLNLLVLVKPGVTLSVPDVMSGRIASVWFPDRDIGLRMLTKGAEPLELGHTLWWKVLLRPESAENVRIGGGSTAIENMRIFSFDGAQVTPLNQLGMTDTDGYPVTWEREDPLLLKVGP
jgi:hypothetical protein